MGRWLSKNQRACFSTLPELLAESLSKYGAKPLFGTRKDSESPYEWMTYAEFGAEVSRFKGLLKARGLKEGQPLAVIANNRPEWAVAAYAAFSLGLPVVPMYESQRPKEWEYIIRHSGAAALVSSSIHHLERISEMHAHHLASGPKSETTAVTPTASAVSTNANPVHKHHRRRHAHRNHDNVDPTKTMEIFLLDTDHSDSRSFYQRVDDATTSSASPPDVGFIPTPQDLACIIFTSGTTALPKGVMLSHDNIISNVSALTAKIGEAYGFGEESHLSLLPWAHVYGQTVELHFAISKGSSVALAQRVDTLLSDLMVAKPSVLVSVPQMFYKINDRIGARLEKLGKTKKTLFDAAMRIARQRREALNSATGQLGLVLQLKWRVAEKVLSSIKATFGGNLKYAITGGGALSADIQHFFADIGIPVIEGYGLTETSPIVACESYGLTEHLQGGMTPLPGVKVLLYEPGTHRLIDSPGEEGEVCVIGRLVMMGYHDNEAATNEVIFITPEGERCFRTGDLGRIRDGVLTITGRCKEQYKLHNGKYVMPSKLEQFALRSRYIEQVYVHGANRPHNVAIIFPDVVDLAQDFKELPSSLPELLANHRPAVEKIILQDLDRIFSAEAHTASYEKIKQVHLISEPFSVANNQLTQKLSMKRRVISEFYHNEINALYAN